MRQTLMVSLIGLCVTAVERVEFIFNLSVVKGEVEAVTQGF